MKGSRKQARGIGKGILSYFKTYSRANAALFIINVKMANPVIGIFLWFG